MSTNLDPELMAAFAALREPFPANTIGKLPRIVCPPCSKARDRVCTEHTKKRCAVCGNFISERHIHLDFVSHALVTDRLLSIDPEWSWDFGCLDPVSGRPSKEASIERDEQGRPIALWMALTVCGVTRRDVGYVDPDAKDEPMKLLVSDALSRCAMRFGVALDLWAKDGLESHQAEASAPAPPPGVDPDTGEISAPPATRRRPPPRRAAAPTSNLVERINALADRQAKKAAMAALVANFGPPDQLDRERLAEAEALVASFERPGLVLVGNGNGNGHS